jgi:hypothetical protein
MEWRRRTKISQSRLCVKHTGSNGRTARNLAWCGFERTAQLLFHGNFIARSGHRDPSRGCQQASRFGCLNVMKNTLSVVWMSPASATAYNASNFRSRPPRACTLCCAASHRFAAGGRCEQSVAGCSGARRFAPESRRGRTVLVGFRQ